MAEGGGVACRAPDAYAEQVAEASDVAVGGVDLLEDAVGAQRLRFMPAFFQGKLRPGAIVRWPWPLSHSLRTSLTPTTDTSLNAMHHLQLAAFGSAYLSSSAGRRISGGGP